MSAAFDASRAGAETLDRDDPLADFRARFELPDGVSYLCGHCLGLPPRAARRLVDEVFAGWAAAGFRAHFTPPQNWLSYPEDHLTAPMAELVGAMPSETALMGSLSSNLHAMMVSFFRPRGGRSKILLEEGAFPSDQHVVDSQLRLHGLSPEEAIVHVRRSGETGRLELSAILDAIERHGSEVALVLLGHTCFRTGQALDVAAIARAARQEGCVVGFDLAHAAGNVELRLHDWDVDFAVWCSYKYLNGGPGGVGGCFVHERHAQAAVPRLAGWWGNAAATRFPREGRAHFTPTAGAAGWQVSSPPILPMAVLRASLEVFREAGMDRLRKKSVRLGEYLQLLLKAKVPAHVECLTPAAPAERGCQTTVRVRADARDLQAWLLERGVVTDAQGADKVRVAAVPLYNRYADVHRFVTELEAYFAR